MSIKRDMCVTRKGLDACIDVTYGTDLIPIELRVVDFTVPQNAVVVAYAASQDSKPRKIICDISDNIISFEPTPGFFEVGVNIMQIRVTASEKELFSYSFRVMCHDNIASDDAEEVEDNPSLVEQLMSELNETKKEIDVECKRIDNIIVDKTSGLKEYKITELYLNNVQYNNDGSNYFIKASNPVFAGRSENVGWGTTSKDVRVLNVGVHFSDTKYTADSHYEKVGEDSDYVYSGDTGAIVEYKEVESDEYDHAWYYTCLAGYYADPPGLYANFRVIIAYSVDADNTELEDIRVGADGVKYNSAGEAVRNQFKNIKDQHENDVTQIRGDLDNLYNDFDFEWKQGYFNLTDGAWKSQANTFFTSKELPFKYIPDEIKNNLILLNNVNSVCSLFNGTEYVGYYKIYDKKYFLPNGTVVDILSFDRFYIMAWYTTAYNAIKIDGVFHRIEDISNEVIDKYDDNTLFEEFGNVGNIELTNEGFVQSDGVINEYKGAGWYYSDYIDISYNKIEYRLAGQNNVSSIAFYDKNKTYISNGSIVAPTTDVISGIVSVPENAKYVIVCNFIYNCSDYYAKYLNQLNLHETLNTIKYGKWKSKTINCLGDSITYGYGLTETNKRWSNVLADMTNATVNNYGLSGSKISDISGDEIQSFCDRISTLGNADLNIVFGGTNDFWHHSTSLGNVTDTSNNTFCGALNYVLGYLQSNQPNAKILFVFPMHQYWSGNTDSHDFGYGTLKDFRNKAKEVCEYRGVYMLDLYSCSGTCVSINETQRDLYTIDGIHPNANGHSLIADIIFNAINYMI